MTETPPRARPRLLRRLLKIALWSGAAMLLLVGLTLAFFHLPVGKEVIRGIIADNIGARFDGEVQLEGFDWALFSDIELKGLTIDTPDGERVIAVDAIRVSPAWGSLLGTPTLRVVAVDGVRVDIEVFEDGTDTLSRMQRPVPAQLVDAVIEKVSVSGLNLRVRAPEDAAFSLGDGSLQARVELGLMGQGRVLVDILGFGGQVTTVAPMTASGRRAQRESARDPRWTGGTRAVFPVSATGQIAIDWGAPFRKGEAGPLPPQPLPREARLTLTPASETVTVESPDPRLGTGPVTLPLSLPPLTASIAGRILALEVGPVGLGPLSTEGLQAWVELGAVSAGLDAVEVRVEVGGFRLNAEALNGLMMPLVAENDLAAPLMLADLTGSLKGKGKLSALAFSGGARWGEASLELKGSADLSNLLLPLWELTLSGADIAPKALLALPEAPEIASDFSFWIKGKGLLPPDADIQTRLDLGGLSVAGESFETLKMAAGLVGETITLERFDLEVLGLTMEASGEADRLTRTFGSKLRGSLALETALSGTALAELLPEPLPRGSGRVDFELDVKGRLSEEALLALEAGVRERRPPVLPAQPLETLTLTGKVVVDALRFGELSLGGLTFGVELKGEGGLPTGPVTLTLTDLEADVQGRPLRLDRVALRSDVGEAETTFTLEVDSASEGIHARVGGALAVDLADTSKPEARLTLSEATVRRGAFDLRLVEGGTLELRADGARLKPLRLAVAGGTVTVAGVADVTPPSDGRAAQLDGFELDLTMQGLQTRRLAAALGRAGRDLGRVPARLDGSLRASGTPARPAADFRLRATTLRTAEIEALTAELSGAIDGRGVRGRFGVRPANARGEDWLDGAFALPLRWPERLGELARPDPSGPLSLTAQLKQRRLQDWGALFGLKGLTGMAELDVAIGGTPASPRGDWRMAAEVGTWPEGLGARRPGPLSVKATGALRPQAGGRVAQEGSLEIASASGPPLLTSRWTGALWRSPFMLPPGAPLPPWELSQGASLDLGSLLAFLGPLLPEGARGVSAEGALTSTLTAAGRGGDLEVSLDHVLEVRAVDLGGLADGSGLAAVLPLVARGEVRVDDTGAAMTHAAYLSSESEETRLWDMAVSAPITSRGLVGRGLRRLARAEGRRGVPLSGHVRVPERALSRWLALVGIGDKAILAEAERLGGAFGGEIRIAGDLEAPRLDGEVGLAGFRTADGARARAALNLHSEARAQRADFVLGPTAGSAPGVTLGLRWPLPIDAARLPLDVQLRAPKVPLTALIPALSALSKMPPIAGALDIDAEAAITASADGAALTALSGFVRLVDLAFPLPDSTRAFHGGLASLSLSPDAVVLEGFEIHERDDHRDARWMKATGSLSLEDLLPRRLALDVTAQDFLVGGVAPDGPEGELDLRLAIRADDLLASPLGVELRFDHLDFDAPDRFVRMHHAQILDHGDVYDPARLKREMPASGKLRVPKGLIPPLPEVLDLKVAIVFPEPGRLGASPLDIDVVGRLDATISKGAIDLRGRLDVPRGSLGAMGWDLEFIEGAIEAHGPMDTAIMELTFGIEPPAAAMRDTTVTGAHGGKAFITARATVAKGLETIFSGVGGPNVLDMATFLNTGRARLWGAPDAPASGTVRFGNLDQGLVLTFIATNLRNFIFMDRTLGWSDSLVEHDRYGQLEWLDMQRFVPGSDTRVFTRGRPAAMGVNRLELGYDWLFVNTQRAAVGFGPRLGLDARLGLGLFWEWASPD